MSTGKNNLADIVISSKSIFTGTSDNTITGSVAIKGNKIIAVGADSEIATLIGPDTKTYKFDNELVMPGFFDAHAHQLYGGVCQESVYLTDTTSEIETCIKAKKFSDEHPEYPWIIGFGWYHVFWKNPVIPTKESLDRYIPDRPVVLFNAEGHGAWINSKALEICHIDRYSKNPPYGEIFKDEKGEPTGYVTEEVMGMVVEKAFDLPADRQRNILRNYLKKAAKLGITSVSDIQYYMGTSMEMGNLDIYKEFEDNGMLTTRFHIVVGLTGNLDRPKYLRKTLTSEKLRFNGLKQLIDGTSTGYTALMVDPYTDNPTSIGSTLLSPEDLKKWIIEADKEGFRVRLHACGDGSVRLGLDCFEAAQKMNGVRDSRHGIEHVEIVKPEDIPRFGKLGVMASVQPEHITITDKYCENPYFARLGEERCKIVWPFRTLLDTGAKMQFGSDFPIVDNNPMLGVYRAVTRLHNDGEPKGGWNPEQKLTMSETLKMYTQGSAYGAFRENDLGTLEPGMLADIVVLSKNLFTIDPEEIRSTVSCLTIMDGQVTYED